MKIHCANHIDCRVKLSGEYNARFIGNFTGEICADFDGIIIALFQGTTNGIFTGTITGYFSGTLNGAAFSGALTQTGTFDLDGEFGGKLDGTFIGNLCGKNNGYLDGFINADINGLLIGRFIGTIDGVPTDPDYPVTNISSELPDTNTGFPPIEFVTPPFETGGPPSTDPPPPGGSIDDVPPGTLFLLYSNNEQTCSRICGDGSTYTSIVPADFFALPSQAAADAAALALACENAELFCSTGTVAPLVRNTRQSCEVTCGAGGTALGFYVAHAGTVSAGTLEEANAAAREFACMMATILCVPISGGEAIPPGGLPPGGGLPPIAPTAPPPNGAVAYSNSDQTATVPCPDGGTFSYTTKVGRFVSTENTATANAMALSFALEQANALRFCLVAYDDIQLNNPISEFRMGIADSPGWYVILQRAGLNSLFLNPYTFTAVGGPPVVGTGGAPVAGSLLLQEQFASPTDAGIPAIWLYSLSFAGMPGVPFGVGQFATVFTVTQDRLAYRIRHTRTVQFFVGDILSDSPLPPATQGESYSYFVLTQYMLGPYTWSMETGFDVLPAGLSLNPTTGEISGTATAIESKTVIIKVTDAAGANAQKEFTIQSVASCIEPAAGALTDGNVNTSYSRQLTAPALIAPLTWSILNGTLADGLNLNPTTGLISGAPTIEGDFSFQVSVTDVENTNCLKNYTLEIGPASQVSCGFWEGVPFQESDIIGDPGATVDWTPSGDLTGVNALTMAVHQPANALAATNLDISGIKTYTGPIVRLKFHVVVSVATGDFDPGDGLTILVSNGGVLLNQNVQAAGTYDFTVNIPESSAIDYQTALTINRSPQANAGDFECSITLAAITIVLSNAVGYFYDTGAPFNPLGQYLTTPGTPNPSCTLTLVSPHPISVQMRARCVHSEGMTGESGSVNGVPIVWEDSNPPDETMVTDPNPMQFDLDACVPKVIQINLTGTPGFNFTGQIYFVPV